MVKCPILYEFAQPNLSSWVCAAREATSLPYISSEIVRIRLTWFIIVGLYRAGGWVAAPTLAGQLSPPGSMQRSGFG